MAVMCVVGHRIMYDGLDGEAAEDRKERDLVEIVRTLSELHSF